MRIVAILLVMSQLAACASLETREWTRQRNASLGTLKAAWLSCVEKKTYEWLDDQPGSDPADKAMRSGKTRAQVFTEVVSACQTHLKLASNVDLFDDETRGFINAAYKRFLAVSLEIEGRRELATI